MIVNDKDATADRKCTICDVVPANRIDARLGFNERFITPKESEHKPLTGWKMESDDAPIFRYLYRNIRPQRHLEFGTWQGWGAVYCLDECEATVWTINLPFGEDKVNGEWAYAHDVEQFDEIRRWAAKLGIQRPEGQTFYRTDQLGFVGRQYLEHGFGNRVCQIYCDSRQWDISRYPAGFFDSVLIDGGHTSDVVIQDTRKALVLLRPGGLIMWHDFCPRHDVRQHCSTPCHVVRAIEENLDEIRRHLSDLFWIDPSWVLVGIRS